MRVKIIESMALKKAIVATSIAAEGIDCTNNENILLADNPDLFSEQIIFLLRNKSEQIRLGENAYQFVKMNFDMKIIANNVLNFINQ